MFDEWFEDYIQESYIYNNARADWLCPHCEQTAKAAWDSQQERVDVLEEELKVYQDLERRYVTDRYLYQTENSKLRGALRIAAQALDEV